MADYKIITDLLAPASKKTLEYNGYHPSKIIKMMSEIIKNTLKVEGGGVFEDKIKWDVSGDPVSFYGEWRGKSSFDGRSFAVFKINVQGSQGAKDKMGKVKIGISGTLETKFPFTTPFHRSAVWFYMYAFYNKQRRGYLEAGKIIADRIEGEIRSAFNLIQRER